jgi:hypothetical protein
MASKASDRLAATIRVLGLAAGYVLWLWLTFPVAFAVMYLVWPVNVALLLGYWAAYGGIAWAVLPSRGLAKAGLAALVPLIALGMTICMLLVLELPPDPEGPFGVAGPVALSALCYGAGAALLAALHARKAAGRG